LYSGDAWEDNEQTITASTRTTEQFKETETIISSITLSHIMDQTGESNSIKERN
jgi:hypothetical protein